MINKKLFFTFIGICVFSTLLYFSFVSLANNVLPIQKVQVQGDFKLQDEMQLQTLLKPLITQKGFLSINLQQIKASLQQLAWISNVSVRRIWPNKIVVHIRKKYPVAIWNSRQLLNSFGESFTTRVSKKQLTRVPQFFGPDDARIAILSAYQQMVPILQPLQLTLTQITIDPAHSWTIQLNNHFNVLLGDAHILTQLQRFVAVYPKVFASRATQLREVDLRYAHGMAVQWQ